MDRDKLRKNINHNLISPLKDKGRVMKLEYVLSNNYFIAAVVIVTDLLLLLVLTFLVTVLSAVPKILTGMIQAEDVSEEPMFSAFFYRIQEYGRHWMSDRSCDHGDGCCCVAARHGIDRAAEWI